MDGVGAEVDGVPGTDEVVNADTALRGEVPDAGVGVGAVVGEGEVAGTVGGVLVVGPEEAAGGLSPRGEFVGAGEVPAQDDGGGGDAGEGAAHGKGGAAEVVAAEDLRGAGLVREEAVIFLEPGRVGLPEGEELDGVLEVAAEGTGEVVAGEDLAGVNASHDEFEVVTHVCDAFAALDDGADLKGERGGIGLGEALLCVRGEGKEGGEGERPDDAEGQAGDS